MMLDSVYSAAKASEGPNFLDFANASKVTEGSNFPDIAYASKVSDCVMLDIIPNVAVCAKPAARN